MRVWITNFKILSKSISFSGLRREKGKKIKIKIKREGKKKANALSQKACLCVSLKKQNNKQVELQTITFTRHTHMGLHPYVRANSLQAVTGPELRSDLDPAVCTVEQDAALSLYGGYQTSKQAKGTFIRKLVLQGNGSKSFMCLVRQL